MPIKECFDDLVFDPSQEAEFKYYFDLVVIIMYVWNKKVWMLTDLKLMYRILNHLSVDVGTMCSIFGKAYVFYHIF